MGVPRKCIIRGCRQSNFSNNLGLKFFRFPSDIELYNIWVDICYGSENLIKGSKIPYICSRHFRAEDVGFRNLAPNAKPALNLNNPPRHLKLKSQEMENTNLRKLLNATVVEWYKRARKASPMLVSPYNIIAVAQKVHKMLGPSLRPMVFDVKWCKWFQEVHLLNVKGDDTNISCDETLNLRRIIRELDPNVPLLTGKKMVIPGEKAGVINSRLTKNVSITEVKANEDSPREKLNNSSEDNEFECKEDCTIGNLNFNDKKYNEKGKSDDNEKNQVAESSIKIESKVDPNEIIIINEPLLENKNEVIDKCCIIQSDSELAKKAIKIEVIDREERHNEADTCIKNEPGNDWNQIVNKSHSEIDAEMIDADNFDDKFSERPSTNKPRKFRSKTNYKYKPKLKNEKHFLIKLNDNSRRNDLLLRIDPEVSDASQFKLNIISQPENVSMLQSESVESDDNQFQFELNSVENRSNSPLSIKSDESDSRDSNIRMNEASPHPHLFRKPVKEDVVDLVTSSDDGCSTKDSTPGVKSPPQINTYEEALKYLEALEHFVLWTEDDEIIGLVSRLESNFKKSRQVLTSNNKVNK